MITDEQWQLYLQKYEKLIWKIARRISGDSMTASLEDNYSDLCLAALESIKGFKKKTGKTFDEMINMKLFDQYTKTVLWHLKANKGVKLTENMPFRNSMISIHPCSDKEDSHGTSGIGIDIVDASLDKLISGADVNNLLDGQNTLVRSVAEAIIGNPSLIREDGGVKLSTIARETGIHITEVKECMQKLSILMKSYEN